MQADPVIPEPVKPLTVEEQIEAFEDWMAETLFEMIIKPVNSTTVS